MRGSFMSARRSTRGTLARNECYSIRFKRDHFARIAKRPLELSLDQKPPSRSTSICLSWSIYCSWCRTKPVTPDRSNCTTVMRSRVPRRDRVSPSNTPRNNIWSSVRYHSQEVKALTEASKSIRSWQINAVRDISFSRTYDTLARRMRSIPACTISTGLLGNCAYASTCRSTSI